MSKWYQRCHSSSDAYRHVITTISAKIYNLDELKYQCRDHIGRGKLENITTALELFEVLEERDLVCQENVNYLAAILNNIRRKDLVKMVNEYSQYWLRSYEVPNYQYQQHYSDPMKKIASDGMDFSSKAFSGFSNVGDNSSGGRYSSTVLAVPFANEVPEIPQFADVPLQRIQEPFQDIPEERDSVIPEPLRGVVDFLSEQLTYSWQAVMRNLLVPEHIIQRSMMNWAHSVRRQVKETLEYWARNSRENSVDVVIDALRVSGRNDLGDMVTSRFRPGRRPMTT